jgi:hypothetical protein
MQKPNTAALVFAGLFFVLFSCGGSTPTYKKVVPTPTSTYKVGDQSFTSLTDALQEHARQVNQIMSGIAPT